MEKLLAVVSYWLGLICTALALILRMLAFFNISHYVGLHGGAGVNYMSFFNGAVLFFLLAIASGCRATKS
jgi:hypothetical protein